jgi:TM2 domain-containing membrane protein YozV
MAKSMFVTYVLWSIGGFFGLHHIYLERDAQAFLWWCTLGGYAGCGWLRDIYHIPEYVADANEDKKFMEKHIHRLRTHERVISFTVLHSRVYITNTMLSENLSCEILLCLIMLSGGRFDE